MKTDPTNPTEVRRDDDRRSDDVETSPEAPYNRTYERPAGEDNEHPDATEDEIERSKEPHHNEVN